MSRHRRNYNLPGQAHELTFSCYRGFKFLAAERTCLWLSESIEQARRELEFDLWAYVFMPQHAHLLIYPRRKEYDIGDIRKAIKAPAATEAIKYLGVNAPHWLPRITRTRSGKTERLFWQSGGGYDRNITEPATLLKALDYFHLNPVRAGFVTEAAAWKWSSAAWFQGATDVPIVPDKIPAEWLLL